MRFDVVTLFPELFAPLLSTGITRRAYESGQVDVHLRQLRDFAQGNYRRVDDRPFGGGPGMVMMAEPLSQCLSTIRAERPDDAPVVLFSPIGKPLNHAMVTRWSESRGAVLICGRYEGLDQRFIDAHVTEQISLGDFVLSAEIEIGRALNKTMSSLLSEGRRTVACCVQALASTSWVNEVRACVSTMSHGHGLASV